MSKQGYKPEISVVRWDAHREVWIEDGVADHERAYLVRGLPMPGERVRYSGDWVVVVRTIFPSIVSDTGLTMWPERLTPYDPESEMLAVVRREAQVEVDASLDAVDHGAPPELAQAVKDAMSRLVERVAGLWCDVAPRRDES